MEIEFRPLKKVVVLGVESRSLENLVWCATTMRIYQDLMKAVVKVERS